ncbi:acyltransferase [Microvirga sp. HBU67558]|uniref:acyltransferase family protein n=1 Tax=Microvirga TaxID=186650 RepID=UPI001B384402|nr:MULTISPECIES: acyltransferase [unclassified Microvirga]MBQ0820531.1 acyltransferase [Microvirga sp. HBU67558]
MTMPSSQPPQASANVVADHQGAAVAEKGGNTSKFGGIEVCRGVAAIWVVLAHATAIMSEPRFYGQEIWDGILLPLGGAGVDFFFVLSGFIITWVHWGDVGQPGRLGQYAKRRFLRIYPAYWAVLFPLALLYSLNPGAGTPSQHDPINLVFSAMLLPYPQPPVLGIAWTLVHEIFFYSLFGLLILAGRRLLWLVPVWIAGIVLAELWYSRLPFPASIFLNALNLEFLMGALAALCLRRTRIPAPALFAVLGCTSFIVLALGAPDFLKISLLGRLAFGTSALLGILGLVEWERSYGMKVHGLFRGAGAASYAIYLVHGVALSLISQLLVRFSGQTLPLSAAFLLLVTGAAAAGYLFHRVVEVRLSRRSTWHMMRNFVQRSALARVDGRPNESTE